MVNLYSSPAQAKFINTYVPIQFEQLYKIADKAEKDLDASNEFMDKLISDSNLNTPSKIDAANWERKVKTPIMQLAEKAASDPDLMKNKAFQAEIKGLTRKIKSDSSVHMMVNNAAAMKQYMANSDARWQGAENENVFNYDSSTNGYFGLKNVGYRSWQEIQEDYTKDIKPTIKRSADGNYFIQSVEPEQVQKAIAGGVNYMSQDPAVQLHKKAAIKNGTAGKYMQMDENGNIIFNEQSFVLDNAYSAAADKIGTFGIDMDPIAKIRMEEQSRLRIAAAQRAAENNGGSPSAVSVTLAEGRRQSDLNKLSLISNKLNRAVESISEVAGGKFAVQNGKELLASGVKTSDLIQLKQYRDQLARNLNNADIEFVGRIKDAITQKENEITGKMRTYLDMKSKSGMPAFGISKRDLSKAETFNVSGPALDGTMVNMFGNGSGFKVKNTSGLERVLFPSTTTRDYKIVDPNSGAEISNTKTADLAKRISNGEFGNNAFFEPSTSFVRRSDADADIIGYMYIPASEFASKYGVDISNPKTAKENFDSKLSEFKGAVGVEGIVLGEKKTENMVKVPVATNAMDVRNSNRATIDNVSTKKNWAAYESDVQNLN